MATQTPMPGFGQDWQVQQDQIARRRKIAEMLMQQGMSPDQGQMVSGHYVAPSPLASVSRLLAAALGSKMQRQADEDTLSTSAARRDALKQTLSDYQSANAGTPAQTAASMALQPNADGTPQQVETQPAVAPDRNRALAVLLNNPDTAQFALQGMLKQQEPMKLGKDEAVFDPSTGKRILYNPGTREHVIGNQILSNEGGGYKVAGTGPAEMKVGPAGQVYDPYAIKPGSVLADPNHPFTMGPGGQMLPNQPYQQYELEKATRGATKINTPISVNTEKTLWGNVAEGVGKQIVAGADQARAAVGTINTVNQIRSAIASGKVSAGPGTNPEIFVRQLGQTLGVGGKDNTEVLLNTRQTIQGLAQLELDAAAQMKGQGQITEAERDIIRRASGGEINKMTTPELTLLMGTIEKTARFKIGQHQHNVDLMRKNQNAAPVAGYLDVQAPRASGPAAVASIFDQADAILKGR